MFQEKEPLDRKVRLRDMTIQDVYRVCAKYDIGVNLRIVPKWCGPWRYDGMVWQRPVMTSDGPKYIDGPRVR